MTSHGSARCRSYHLQLSTASLPEMATMEERQHKQIRAGSSAAVIYRLTYYLKLIWMVVSDNRLICELQLQGAKACPWVLPWLGGDLPSPGQSSSAIGQMQSLVGNSPFHRWSKFYLWKRVAKGRIMFFSKPERQIRAVTSSELTKTYFRECCSETCKMQKEW